MACSAYILTAHYAGDTLALSLERVRKPGVPAYIGSPPAEIERLVQETISTGRNLSQLANAASKCVDALGPTCQAGLALLRMALPTVNEQFAAWKPYGVS